METRGRLSWLRYGIAGLVAVAALALGVCGFLHYPAGQPMPRDEGSWLDLIYKAFALFGLNFDPTSGAALPWQLQVARFLAPASALVAVVVGISGLIGRALRSWWSERGVRRVLVVGTSLKAELVASSIRATGAEVRQVPTGDWSTLRRAGVKQADALYACEDWPPGTSGDINVATAKAVVTRRRALEGRVYAHVSHLSEAWSLRIDTLKGLLEPQRVEYFNLDEIAARGYLEDDVFTADGPARVLIVGASSLAEAMMVALGRKVRADRDPGARLAVTLVDPYATREAAAYADRWPIVRETCDIEPVDAAARAYLPTVSTSTPPDRIYICHNEEATAFAAAMGVDATWPRRSGPVVVLLGQFARPALSFDTRTRIQGVGPIVVMGVETLAAPAIGLGAIGPVHDLAKQVHELYLAERLRQGSTEHQRPWDELSEDFKRANYAEARDLNRKLGLIGATIEAWSADNPPFRLLRAEVEQLAKDEHERWLKERRREGWRHGATKDEQRKRHPIMVPWKDVKDDDKETNRALVRGLETVYGPALAELDLQIVRTGPGRG